jgi:DNA recombination protein RmuC
VVEALIVVGGLLFTVVVLQIALLWRSGAATRGLAPRLDQLGHASERGERALREELAKSREEAAAGGRHLREEIAKSVVNLGDSLAKNAGESAAAQKNQLDSFAKQLHTLTESNEKRLNELRGVVDGRLQKLQEDNAQKLDKMRETVDEKLQGTLEKRLGEAFQQVSERLEAVHKGLGEMQSLANGVGDLKKVLTNVKTRGIWGEVQLADLLEQIFTPDQYERNVAVKRGSAERVDFALKLPGRADDDQDVVWLPIDAKFPTEDYHRLVDATEQGDAAAAEQARRALEVRVLGEARSIRDKYVNPPRTTDFGILFVPSEALYAEVLRSPGIIEKLQRESRVIVAGPTSLAAILNSLQMGFRTLAIQKRSSEVWKLLGAVKRQFGQFSGILDKVQVKLQQASNTLEDASQKSRTIERRLRKVEELPSGEADRLLPELEAEMLDDAADDDPVS